MSKAKLRFITIFALAVLCVFTLGLAISALPVGRRALAATYSPASLFEAIGDSLVDASEAEEGQTAYVRFNLADGDRIEYRRDLALKWYVAAGEEKTDAPAEGEHVSPAEEKHFSMTFAFGEISFESFDITFQSAEENVSKDGQTTNALHFEYKLPADAEAGAAKALTVAIRDADFEEGDEDAAENIHTIADIAADLTFELIENDEVPGNFDVMLTEGEGDATRIGAFTNIGGYFMEYRSTASSSSQLPMAFEAELPAAAEGEEAPRQVLFMRALNGQPLSLNKDGVVEDTASPVLVVNEKIYSFRLGQRFSLTYEAIDVCDSSVSVTRQYYMLKTAEDAVPEGSPEGTQPVKHYVKPSDSDYSSLTSSSTFFMPTSDGEEEETAYVSIRFKLDDGTDANDTYVYLTWYADPDADVVHTIGDEGYETTTGYKCPVCGKVISEEDRKTALEENADAVCTGEKDNPVYDENATEGDEAKEKIACDGKIAGYEEQKEGNYFDYILVDREVEGPHFIGLEANDNDKTNHSVWTPNSDGRTAVETYQDDLAAIAEDVSAGDGAYFYLPSLETLIGSSYADYRNLRFNIYYYKPNAADGSSASSATSLRYNNLRFEVDQVGLYTFRVIAQDAAGNMMKYYDEDGDLVTVTASNVFQIDGIPEFTFEIGYNGPTIEKAGKQTTGYNKQSYTISSFDIVALEGYDTEYRLFSFENVNLEEGEKVYDYETLVKVFDEVTEKEEGNDLFAEGNQDLTAEGEKYSVLKGRLNEIQKYDSNVTEKDDKWEDTDNDYAWDPDSSLSFLPQAVGFYVVEINVIDGTYPGLTAHAYKVIDVTNESDILYGSSNWIKNNTTAIILFAISAVLLVAIILLLVIKPNEKNLEEVDLNDLKGVKKKTDKHDKN